MWVAAMTRNVGIMQARRPKQYHSQQHTVVDLHSNNRVRPPAAVDKAVMNI